MDKLGRLNISRLNPGRALQVLADKLGKLSFEGINIGAKRGGTREQCSQKLFELAEIFRKKNKKNGNFKYI